MKNGKPTSPNGKPSERIRSEKLTHADWAQLAEHRDSKEGAIAFRTAVTKLLQHLGETVPKRDWWTSKESLPGVIGAKFTELTGLEIPDEISARSSRNGKSPKVSPSRQK